LLNAIISLCARVSEQTGIRIHRELQGPIPNLGPDAELAVYRIAQEALTNAVRHSNASEVTVSLACSDGDLLLSIKDNGAGLPDDAIAGGGLTGMHERAMLIDADLEVASTAREGVEVTLRLKIGA
jgi:two-component system sensor histidine kinase UhpB